MELGNWAGKLQLDRQSLASFDIGEDPIRLVEHNYYLSNHMHVI